MKNQQKIGIEVKGLDIEKHGDDYFFRDYLIQDDILLVDLSFNGESKHHKDAVEKITLNGVAARLHEFETYWGLGKDYT